MDKNNNLKTKIEALLKQPLAVLATKSEESPYTSLVGFIANKEINEIYFATLSNTTKYKNIVNNPTVSLLIDNRTNKLSDFTESSALTVIGKNTATITEKTDTAFTNYLSKYPNLKDFIYEPLCILIKIKVSKYVLVEKFKELEVLDLD